MYLVGAPHSRKVDAQRLVERALADSERLVTDAILGVVDDVFSIDLAIVERAKTIVLGRRPLSAHDAVHVAVMERERVDRVLSFDTGFDGYPGITRLGG